MAEKWGKNVVKDVPPLPRHHIRQGVFPIKGTLSTECLERCRVMLEERKKEVGKKGIDWQVFQKWEREAEIKEVKSLTGLMIKQKAEKEKEGVEEEGSCNSKGTRNVGKEKDICLLHMHFPPFQLGH